MAAVKKKWTLKRWLLLGSGGLVLFVALMIFLANFYVEPVLRKRLHTLIVDGSDSLYSYTLGSLNVNFWGGHVGVNNLRVQLDSSRYRQLKSTGKLPALVMQLDIARADIKGIGILSLLFGRKIVISEISSREANLKLNRYVKNREEEGPAQQKQPLWKAIQPAIKDVRVDRIKLDGIKFLYKNEDGEEGKLQFDHCDALFENIRIDSAVVDDTSRMGYVENISFRLNDLKYRTTDSTYKLKAEWITYNSAQRLLQVEDFKLQPTIKNEDRIDSMRKSWYTVTFDKVSFMGLRLDKYLQQNRAVADSVIFQRPTLAVYQDKLGQKNYGSKIGRYPHQLLLAARSVIDIKKFVASNMQIDITEKHEDTRQVGTLQLTDINLTVMNIVNDPVLIRQNPVSTADASGKIIGSPIQASFRFYLDSADGRFDVRGRIGATTAAQLNPVSTRLANIEVPTVQISSVDFFVRGEDYEATSNVQMLYNNLTLVFRKRDEETGANQTRKFLTKILNRYAINTSNGGERKATDVRVARLTTQSFFGIIWKAVFEGMQRIMLKSGQIR
ncbi:MAG TPA: hypothetical protein VGN63_16130 [Flavisolibacter sp.]|jgi:hypothetical protein|nr:hypothetical protein [Flavisolibacter sp.]